MPKNRFYEAAIFYKPLSNIGGDIYDYIKANDDESFFCLADVSGKGIAAALLMANFLANLRALVNVNTNLIDIAHQLNQKVVENARGERFVTMFLAKYNNKTKILSYLNAAHNPTLLYQNDKVTALTKGCVGMGMLDTIPHIETEDISLNDNSIMVAYTDGIIDVLDKNGNEFEIEDLNKIIKKHQHTSVELLNGAIMDSVALHKGDMPYVDDIALMSVRFI